MRFHPQIEERQRREVRNVITLMGVALKSCKEVDEEFQASELVLRFIRHSFKHVDVITKVSAFGSKYKASTSVDVGDL